MKMVMAEDHTVGALRRSDAFANRQAIDLSQAVSLLIASGYLHPALPVAVRTNARAGTDRLNAAICAFNADGGDIPRLAAATIGSEVGVDLLETFLVREKLSGRSMEIEGLTERVFAGLMQAGRSMQRDGRPVNDLVQARAIVREALDTGLTRRLPVLKRLGAI
jgi:hypothetical protein